MNVRKCTDLSLINNLHTIHTAIGYAKRIQFYYFTYNEKHEKTFMPRWPHEVEPIEIVYYNNYCYLISYSNKNPGFRHFRIDHMDEISVLDRPSIHKNTLGSVSDYISQVFNMFNGTPADAVISFKEKQIKSIYDKFGDKVLITRHPNEGIFSAAVPIQESPGFYSWVLSFGGDVKIIYPESLKSRFNEWIKKTLNELNYTT